MNDINKIIHDIRNPLNSIAMNAELAKLLAENNGDPERLKSAIDTILAECRNCADVLASHQEDRD